jgi:hypothetical protein
MKDPFLDTLSFNELFRSTTIYNTLRLKLLVNSVKNRIKYLELSRYLSVDHNHKSNKIRGLLCSSCNLTLGQAEENPRRLLALARYIRVYQ